MPTRAVELHEEASAEYDAAFDWYLAQWAVAGMKVRDVIKRLEQDGWRIARTKGSHRQFHRPAKPGTDTVAGHPSWTFRPER